MTSRPLPRAGIAATALVGILAAIGVLWGPEIGVWLITPGHGFDSAPPPPPPDYADPASWSALPTRSDAADVVPPGSGARDLQHRAEVDTFYVHPTSYFFGGAWNASTTLKLTNFITDGGPVAQQASAFNGISRVYAPRYRQMTLSGYWQGDDRESALGLAYGDVSRAFRHYLEHWNAGRPFFLVSHSQGSHHLDRLLRDEIEATPLAGRLIAAYVVGGGLLAGRFAAENAPIGLCDAPEATGCVIAWSTFVEGGDPSQSTAEIPEGESQVCTNPLSWRIDATPAPASDNLGSIPLVGATGLGEPDLQLVGARCDDGVLWVDEPKAPGYDRALFPGGNYHTYDFNLFYMNIRANAELRARAILTRR